MTKVCARIIKYDLFTGQSRRGIRLHRPTSPRPSTPPAFADNGLVELLPSTTPGPFWRWSDLRRGRRNNIRLYIVRTQGVSMSPVFDSLDDLEADPSADKTLLLDFADLNIPLDNIEGMTLGPGSPMDARP